MLWLKPSNLELNPEPSQAASYENTLGRRRSRTTRTFANCPLANRTHRRWRGRWRHSKMVDRRKRLRSVDFGLVTPRNVWGRNMPALPRNWQNRTSLDAYCQRQHRG